MKIVAVVFDMDGVLFDTERIGVQCWTEAAEPTGLQNAREIARMCIGRTIPGTKEVFMEEAAKQGVALDFEKLHEDCARLILEKEERDGLPVKPGVHEILEYLYERKIPVALATSSKKDIVLSHLEKTGITKYFRKIVTGDMVSHGKPAPDIYIKACEELEAAPENVIAIEDSFNGIRSASAAGLHPIMVPISCSLPRRFSCWLRQSATACWRSESYCRRSICKYQRVSKSIKAYIRELSI